MSGTHSVKLLPNCEVVTIDALKTVGPALKALGYPIQSGCAGYGYCADCLVTVVEGAENVEPPTYDERRMIGFVFHDRRYYDPTPARLACQLRITGPVTLDITEHLEKAATMPTESAPIAFVPLTGLTGRKTKKD